MMEKACITCRNKRNRQGLAYCVTYGMVLFNGKDECRGYQEPEPEPEEAEEKAE